MINLFVGVLIRIFSNSYLNVFQKILTNKGEHSSIINFYTYLGLSIIGLIICPNPIFNLEILPQIITMGSLGALGNYFIIKALSCGELSSLAPINSYKPIVALIIGIFLLNEYPGIQELIGIILILIGTFLLAQAKIFFTKATLYRIIALLFLGTEAIFIKKVILLTNINTAFLFWVLTGFLFTVIFALFSKHSFQISKANIKYQIGLIFLVTLMQYSTNYVFAKMNVAYALALFQLSSIVSLFLGANIFKERGIINKLIATIIMLIGACFIILN